jgi:hypothetical protein
LADYADLVTQISAAVDAYDKPRASHLCDALVARIAEDADPSPSKLIRQVASALRRKRYFALMSHVTDRAIQSGQTDPQLERQYAQSLIEQDALSAAIGVLTVLVLKTAEGPGRDEEEHAEARGLLGRAYKQAYVNAILAPTPSPDGAGTIPIDASTRRQRAMANRRHLEAAIRAYHEVYLSDPAAHTWHGINTVACVCRARRDDLPIPDMPEPHAIARAILARFEGKKKEEVPPWDLATALEACVALDLQDEALAWLGAYVASRGADAFELASTLRQLEQVWELATDKAPGSAILPVLKSELLRREGGEVRIESASAEGQALEAILGDTRFVSVAWYRTGLQRCEAVARIEDQFDRVKGTGFLVRGEDLHEELAGEFVLVTNAHVVSADPQVRAAFGALAPAGARVRFEAHDPGQVYKVAALLWSSPPMKLDATLLRLEASVACDPPYPFAVAMPSIDTDRVYVIGHPGGGTLSLSIQDNRVVDAAAPKLHYRAPTAKGNSGSPVFNSDWELVALHHAGGERMPRLSAPGEHPANEGIWMSSILSAFGAEYARAVRPPAPARSEEPADTEP